MLGEGLVGRFESRVLGGRLWEGFGRRFKRKVFKEGF